MPALLLETSGRVGLVGLAEGDLMIAERRLDGGRQHARDLVPAIRDLLADEQCEVARLTGIAMSIGPGSYTGLRVGAMVAKSLAYIHKLPLVAVETFAIIARQSADVDVVEVIADAQPPNLYSQHWHRSDGRWQPTEPIQIPFVADWLGQRKAPIPLTGPGCAFFADRLGDAVQLPEMNWLPTLPALAAIGAERFAANELSDPFSLEPLYLRPSSAERLWDARTQRP